MMQMMGESLFCLLSTEWVGVGSSGWRLLYESRHGEDKDSVRSGGNEEEEASTMNTNRINWCKSEWPEEKNYCEELSFRVGGHFKSGLGDQDGRENSVKILTFKGLHDLYYKQLEIQN